MVIIFILRPLDSFVEYGYLRVFNILATTESSHQLLDKYYKNLENKLNLTLILFFDYRSYSSSHLLLILDPIKELSYLIKNIIHKICLILLAQNPWSLSSYFCSQQTPNQPISTTQATAMIGVQYLLVVIHRVQNQSNNRQLISLKISQMLPNLFYFSISIMRRQQ